MTTYLYNIPPMWQLFYERAVTKDDINNGVYNYQSKVNRGFISLTDKEIQKFKSKTVKYFKD